MGAEATRMNPITAHLQALYPEEDADQLTQRIEEIFSAHAIPVHAPREFSERDVLLITYADTLQQPGTAPLQTLMDFMTRRLGDTFSALHLLPFFPSTSDDGFAVSAFREVREDLGSWDDIRRLAERFDLMTDLVLNHCSREHPLARRLWAGDDTAAAWFHLQDPQLDVSGIVRPRATPLITPLPNDPQGRGVWTTFSDDQIDFNYQNPQVLLEILDVMAQYLATGARLLRLDAVAFLWKELGTPCIHHPQTHRIIRLLHCLLQTYAPNCRLVSETNVPEHENLSYFGEGDEADMVYQFALPSLTLQALHRGSSVYLNRWLHQWATLPPGCSFLNFIASHDGIGVRPVEHIITPEEMTDLLASMREFGGRISTRQDNAGQEQPYEINISLLDALRGTRRGVDGLQVERLLCAHTILLSLPGVPAFYLHSLLASPNDEALLQKTQRARSINRGQLDLCELEQELDTPGTVRSRGFEGTLQRIRIRRAHPAFAPQAPMTPLSLGSGFFAVTRGQETETILVLCNLTAQTQRLHLDTSVLHRPRGIQDLITRRSFRVRQRHRDMHLEPYQCLWLKAI